MNTFSFLAAAVLAVRVLPIFAQSDYEALSAFYKSAGQGEANLPWTAGWMESTEPCDWGSDYISCDSDDQVTWMELSGEDVGVSGSIPTELGYLSSMTDLMFLSGTEKLIGTVPTQLGMMTAMKKEFSFIDHGFSGTIPTEFGQLTAITVKVRFFQNSHVTGTLPTELGQMTKVKQKLYMNSNALTGTIPTEFGSLTKYTKDFNLADNLLTGQIPTQLAEMGLTALAADDSLYLTLNFLSNNLCGDVPAALLELSQLNNIFTDGNSIGTFCIAPTGIPTTLPTGIPTLPPSNEPSSLPTVVPSAVPTTVPTAVPSSLPTAVPSAVPTTVPTAVPSSLPTAVPSAVPTTVAPTTPGPTSLPTSAPTAGPTTPGPTSLPTSAPTAGPTVSPVPSVSPSHHDEYCEDDSEWHVVGSKNKDCDWVAKYSASRCNRPGTSPTGDKLAHRGCKATCMSECVPTSVPTTLSPTMDSVVYKDNSSWYIKNKPWLNCYNFVAESPWGGGRMSRCRRAGGDGTRAFTGCCATCGTCENQPTPSPTRVACSDSSDWRLASKPQKGCSWVSKYPLSRCGRKGVDDNKASKSCPVACDTC